MHPPGQNFTSSEEDRGLERTRPAEPAVSQQLFRSLIGAASFHQVYEIRTNAAVDSRRGKQ